MCACRTRCAGGRTGCQSAIGLGGAAQAAVWFRQRRVPAPAAVFANSCMAHALDLDDVHLGAILHITSLMVPAAVGVGQWQAASGRDVLDALTLGIEVAGRIGREHWKRRVGQGFLPSSVVGGFGVAAAACRLLGCTVEQTENAMGIYYAHASGNRQALFDHTLTKRIQPAIAARAGVVAADLAQRGLSGPREVLDGEAGLMRIYGAALEDELPEPETLAAPRETFEIEQLSFKRFACCGGSHPVIQAAIDLANEFNLSVDSVERITLSRALTSPFVGAPWDDDAPSPQALAQFSAPYDVAAAIKYRRFGAREIDEQTMAANPDVAELAHRVEIDREGEHSRSQTITIITRDGRTLTATRDRDHVLRPDLFDDEALARKFRENAHCAGVDSNAQIERFIEDILHLDRFETVEEFASRWL